MKVMHLSTTDYGGAYEDAQRISDSLTDYGIESAVLVRTKTGDTPSIPFFDSLPQKFLSKTKNFFNLLLSEGDIVIDKYGADICGHPLVKEADAICLHWVNSFISNREVANILTMGKPVYWVMHDVIMQVIVTGISRTVVNVRWSAQGRKVRWPVGRLASRSIFEEKICILLGQVVGFPNAPEKAQYLAVRRS